MFAVSGFGRFSASFSNVLYASMVYWKRVLSCWLVRVTSVASTVVIYASLSVVGFRLSAEIRFHSRQPTTDNLLTLSSPLSKSHHRSASIGRTAGTALRA